MNTRFRNKWIKKRGKIKFRRLMVLIENKTPAYLIAEHFNVHVSTVYRWIDIMDFKDWYW